MYRRIGSLGTYRATRGFLVLLLASTISLPLLAETTPVSIKFTTNPDGFVMVPAKLGGTIPIQVIFDTGAGLDVLASSLIEKLHGKPEGQFTAFRMTGERLDIPLFRISELSVGPMVRKDVLVAGWDMLDKLGVDGIISANDFRQQPFTFDFIHKIIVFETPQTLRHRRSEGASSPLKLDDQRGITLDLFAQFQFAGQLGQCEIDTGTQRSATLSIRYMAALGIAKDGPNVRQHVGRTIAGATETRYDTTLQQMISLAAAPQVMLKGPAVSFSDIIYDCVVGLDFWSGKALTINIPQKELIVSDQSPAARANR